MQQTVLRYLLEEMDAGERESVDTLLVSNDEYHATFHDTEHDLIDAYAAGELSQRDETRVERALQPDTRFAVAQGLQVDRLASRSAQLSPVQKRREFFSIFRRPVAWAMAAALIVAGTLTFSRWQMRSNAGRQIHRAQPASQASATPAAPIANVTIANANAARETSAHAKQTASSGTPSASTAILLLAGPSRAQNALPLVLSAVTKTVQIEWVPPATDDPHARYQLQVLDDSGALLYSGAAQVRSLGRKQRAVIFTCPAKQLPAASVFVRIFKVPLVSDGSPLLEAAVEIKRTPTAQQHE